MTDALASYEAEQAKLMDSNEGTDVPMITVPKEPEVNPEVWKDVEPMLFRGFLTVAAKINNVHFVFKSLNHHEFDLLRFTGHLSDDGTVDQEFWSTFISYGVFMVDGVNILPSREAWIPRLAKVFEEIPKEARADIIRHMGEINRRAARAVPLTEAYCMESVSRYRWLQLKGLDLTSVSVTGIDGSQRLGLNWAQQLWRAINQVEDRNEQHERDWENAKFVGSCFAGKGISKVYNQDNDRRRKDREDRQSRKDRILREILLGEKIDSTLHSIPGAIMMAPKTVDDLAAQLERDIKGEKDWHDQVVEAHEAEIKRRYLERQKQIETAAVDNEDKFWGHKSIGSTSFEGLTQAQSDERVLRAKQLEAQRVARILSDPREVEEKTERFLEKWGRETTTEISTTDRDTSGALPLPAPKAPTTPFKGK